ncbi:uncharacterized protein LOC123654028 [Melitaea cinxia]|uniref:uncharacterized protein LOC123654028 n=1 Tax=Melitaea cinxia TaxID=113334 RepID=UPI001E271E60|nr:uncharacterized protein LOC123654028 [Melitaea cinxia]XP_045445948.1 uncharacterized protein LOC123654028 [Melitaea cinxia]
MDKIKSTSWAEGEFEATEDPNISIVAEEVPTLTVATILGVAIVILIAIVVVFALGVLVDWRQQRLLNKKIGEVKRMKNHKRTNTYTESDVVSIATNMEEASMSTPPADALRNIP